ncbi:Methionine--tRNA ligase [Candidatus Vallotia tarda]|uniref:Methionine--tRNA ligase n=1 Tax=Candidatus Vallotiella hemipterorum TaxID=1177213 RepID=A0A916JSV7_9BURK|nr:Methionine--tRNA ligase [Candidatus Vallotia tarda]
MSSSVLAGVPRRMLVTSALPYANGPIHIGHLIEYVQTDIWVRAMRMHGHEVYYVCADDTHGTPVMLRAQFEEIKPCQLIQRVWHEHKRDFNYFGISFDNYYSTDSDENRVLSETIFTTLYNRGLIAVRDIEQAYDPIKKMFLPDRFIKGNCPRCGEKDQYGDNCEACGSIYQTTELVKPYSVLSGVTPVNKTSTHYFFKLSDPLCETFLRGWVGQLAQKEATNKMLEWLSEGGDAKLADWDITRDAPYFGFEIPGSPGKYFYVWLDAPVGYYASFKNLCDRHGLNFDEWVRPESTTEQYHFIGKDILYFHTLFWPAMLKFSGYRTPTNVFAHGFLTVEGKKMSKSRGTFISANSYITTGLDPQWLRYYFATKLNSTMGDIDLNFDDFRARVNSDLLGKYVNIASRTATFLVKGFNACVLDSAMNHQLLIQLRTAIPAIATYYESREYGRAVRQVMVLANAVNAYIDEAKPWRQAKDLNHSIALHETCSISLEGFRLLTLALKPVLPKLAESVERFLSIEPLTWADVTVPLSSMRPIRPYQDLMRRIEPQQINKLLLANQ